MDLASFPPPRVVGRVPFRAYSHAHAAVSPDGRHVALLSGSAVELFDAEGGRLAQLQRRDVRGCGCFLDDARLLVGGTDGALLLFDVDALALAGTLRDADALALGVPHPCATSAIGCVTLSPDGASVAVASGEPSSRLQKADKLVRVLDAATLQPRLALKGVRRRTTDVAFSHDGKRLAVAGDSVVRVYELSKGKAVGDVGDEDDHGVVWRPDGALLTLGRTHGLRAWNLPDRTVSAQHPFPQQTLRGPRWTADGSVVVVTGGSFLPMVVHRLDPATLTTLATRDFDRMPPWPGQPVPAPDGTLWVAYGVAFERLRGPDLTALPAGDGHVELVERFVVHPGGRWAATADMASNVSVWDLDAGEVVYRFPAETRAITPDLVSRCRVLTLAASEGAPRFFLTTEHGGVRSWDASTGAPGWSLEPGAFPLTSHYFPSPDGEALLTANITKQGRVDLTLVDSRGGRPWQTDTDVYPRRVRWEDDAVVLFGVQGSVRLRRPDGALTDRWLLPREAAVANATAFSVSEDGARAAAVDQFRLSVWETEGPEVLCAVDPRKHGLAHPVGVDWSPDGSLLLLDGGWRLDARDPSTLGVRSSMTLPTSVRWRVFVTRGGRRLVMPTHEGTWLVYDAG